MVTGAARGIGRAIAERFVRDGMAVIVVDIDAVAVARATEELGAAALPDRPVLGQVADCSDRWDVERVVATSVDRFGRLDVFVANAGIGRIAPLLDTPDELWDATMAINLRGAYLGVQAAGRAMRRTGGGRIVATASTNAFWMGAELAAYNASKAGLVGLVRTAAMELAPFGITVNAVGPRAHRDGPHPRHGRGSGASSSLSPPDPDGPLRLTGRCRRRGGLPRLGRCGVDHRPPARHRWRADDGHAFPLTSPAIRRGVRRSRPSTGR
jgi:NAD(P)-dependent dehydrogenase (short-subunit alcohol dehydrogenase family)